MRPVATFSIVARDPGTGDLGVATASKFLAVGAVVPHAVAGVGAVATQSYANTSFGPRAVAALRAGIPLAQIQAGFAAGDADHAIRQYGMVDAGGDAVSFTGEGCHPWAGGRSGDGYAVQGNLLAGPEVIDALEAAFLEASGPLPERLLAALAAADRAGGDARGRQAAALLVVREGGGYGGQDDRMVDLRVDDHDDPVPRLGGLLRLHRLYFGSVRDEDRLAIEGEVETRLLRGLAAQGRLPEGHGAWDARAEAALRAWAGVENLEERLLPGGRVDRRVLDVLDPPREDG
jgi:uncharacterized Ntn-hydrolase superfamily protein